jgi:hypothetical protein
MQQPFSQANTKLSHGSVLLKGVIEIYPKHTIECRMEPRPFEFPNWAFCIYAIEARVDKRAKQKSGMILAQIRS